MVVGERLLQTGEAEGVEARQQFGRRERVATDGTLHQVVDALYQQRRLSDCRTP